MIDIPCIIFAGGKSSRMGEDKALLPFAGYSTLAEYQYSRLTKIFSTVYISCKDKSKFDFEANFIEDDKAYVLFAPTVGFYSIYNQLQEERFFVVSVDTPFINHKIIRKIVNVDKESNDATIAMLHDKIQPLCGIYHRSLFVKLQTMMQEQNHKLGYLLKNSNSSFVTYDDKRAFMNLNEKGEYNKALTLATTSLQQ